MISLLFEPQALAEQSDDRRFAFDSYRRFIQMYADVVLGIEVSHFEKMLERAKQKRGVKQAGDSLFRCFSLSFSLRFRDFFKTFHGFSCSFMRFWTEPLRGS